MAKRIDIKYDKVMQLTLRFSFRAWTDRKADLKYIWARALWTYETNKLKIPYCVNRNCH